MGGKRSAADITPGTKISIGLVASLVILAFTIGGAWFNLLALNKRVDSFDRFDALKTEISELKTQVAVLRTRLDLSKTPSAESAPPSR